MMERDEILVVYGDDPYAMAIRLAEEAGLADLAGDRNKRIGLKPNLVVARPADEGATTHVEICAALVDYLHQNGFSAISILEGSWTGARTADAFRVCGYRELAAEKKVGLIDTQADTSRSCDCRGMKIEICDSALGIDFMINLPVMKGHCQTLLTCALKNNKGIIPDREKRRFHSLGLHKPIAHLNTVARNDFIIADGICGDLDFEEGGNPVPSGRMFAARDPVLCDAFAASLMGYSTAEIPYIGLAEKLKAGSADIGKAKIRELSPPDRSGTFVKPGAKVRALARYIREADACSACYAGLVFALSRMDRRDLSRLEPVAVGQGFRGKKGIVGVGKCTASFAASCPGCPPGGVSVLEFLKKQIQ